MKKTIFTFCLTLIVFSVKAQWTDNGNKLTTSDSVGIGTISPKAKFHVNNGMFLIGNATYNSLVEQIRIGRYDNPDIRYHSIYSNHDAVPSNNYLQFRIHDAGQSGDAVTSQKTVMTITGGGQVGIGTTSPNAKLQVNSYTGSGNAISFGSITSFSNSGDIGLYLGVANENIGARGWGFSPRSVGVNSSLDIIEKGLNGTRMTIASGGYIGIGTANPSKKLDIYNATIEESFRLTTGTDGRVLTMRGETINFNRAGSNYIAASHTSGALLFSTGGANIYGSQIRMRIKADGSVGIGTANTGSHRLAV